MTYALHLPPLHSSIPPLFLSPSPSLSPSPAPLTARSPVYSHISTTLQGLSVIRAFRKQGVAMQQYHQCMNGLSQGTYLYMVINTWFGIRIDLLCAIFMACVVYSSVPLASSKGLAPTPTLHSLCAHALSND